MTDLDANSYKKNLQFIELKDTETETIKAVFLQQ